MNLLIAITVIACTLGQPGAPPAPPVPPAPVSPSLMSRLERVDAKMAAVQDICADFEQSKKTVMLKKPLVSKGHLLSRADTVLWVTREPRAMSMLVTHEELSMFYPDDKLVEVYRLDARFREAAGGPLPRLVPLKERFDLAELDPRELGAVGPTDNLLGLHLTPKSDELKRHIAWVRVLIDERVPCATWVMITDPDGERTEIRFSNVRINSGVADPDLKLRLPDGVRVSRPIPDAPAPRPAAGAPDSPK